ncbi:hypothetical protein, partial [Klebsiella variicola]|uniref:hypothetical protein n=1 Tax=Klebsiella variicola TaxID=244366 RepID=UPI0039C1616D
IQADFVGRDVPHHNAHDPLLPSNRLMDADYNKLSRPVHLVGVTADYPRPVPKYESFLDQKIE